jgi:hypothetical protein
MREGGEVRTHEDAYQRHAAAGRIRKIIHVDMDAFYTSVGLG